MRTTDGSIVGCNRSAEIVHNADAPEQTYSPRTTNYSARANSTKSRCAQTGAPGSFSGLATASCGEQPQGEIHKTVPVAGRWLNTARTRRARRAERRREIAERYEACENFLGSKSPNPDVSAFHRERARLALLNSHDISEEYRQRLRDKGPHCTPEQWHKVSARYAERAARRAEEAAANRRLGRARRKFRRWVLVRWR